MIYTYICYINVFIYTMIACTVIHRQNFEEDWALASAQQTWHANPTPNAWTNWGEKPMTDDLSALLIMNHK